MMFYHHPLRYPWWFGSYKLTKAMVDFQINLERWLEDVTLFKTEPVDNELNFDELLGLEKTTDEGGLAIPGLSDLGWLDEKVDLSVFDNSYNLLNPPNEAETLMVEDAANLLLDFMDSTNLDPSPLSSENQKICNHDFLKDLQVPVFQCPVPSPEISASHLASPGVTSLQVDSPFFFHSPVSSPGSSFEAISDSSPLSSPMVASPSSAFNDSSGVVVTVYDESSRISSENGSNVEAASLEEISKSVKEKKYINRGKEISKFRVLMKDSFHPYSVAPPKVKDRRERKKVQNKEAAARYRIKKRMEEHGLSDEVSGLESEQKKLQKKHDELKAEIKYLKSLMCEILMKKGSLK